MRSAPAAAAPLACQVRAVASEEHWVWPLEEETAALKAGLAGGYASYANPK